MRFKNTIRQYITSSITIKSINKTNAIDFGNFKYKIEKIKNQLIIVSLLSKDYE